VGADDEGFSSGDGRRIRVFSEVVLGDHFQFFRIGAENGGAALLAQGINAIPGEEVIRNKN